VRLHPHLAGLIAAGFLEVTRTRRYRSDLVLFSAPLSLCFLRTRA